jgi:hypothetical protein
MSVIGLHRLLSSRTFSTDALKARGWLELRSLEADLPLLPSAIMYRHPDFELMQLPFSSSRNIGELILGIQYDDPASDRHVRLMIGCSRLPQSEQDKYELAEHNRIVAISPDIMKRFMGHPDCFAGLAGREIMEPDRYLLRDTSTYGISEPYTIEIISSRIIFDIRFTIRCECQFRVRDVENNWHDSNVDQFFLEYITPSLRSISF